MPHAQNEAVEDLNVNPEIVKRDCHKEAEEATHRTDRQPSEREEARVNDTSNMQVINK